MGDSPVTFLKQSIKDFRTTGAIAPSSLFLCRALAKSIPSEIDDNFRVIEVGAGTGCVSEQLAKRMNGRGRLELCEISPAFCKVIKARMARERAFQKMGDRVKLLELDVRKLPAKPTYDRIVSGLPFSCFNPDEVRGFIEHFRALLKPDGELAWFEYVAIRELQTPFVSKKRRAQLKGIDDVTKDFIRAHQVRQEIIPINFPPARIRHLKFG